MVDPLKPVGPPTDEDKPAAPMHRLLWFAGLALLGLIAVAGTSYLLRAFLFLG